ncbi:serine hydrolase [Ohtaekwangia sp.]|uniref:serine hydrolase n=1 Tax=Ohtaekwangia sp. TaxID=2066019 RepID=UPI002FDD7E8F
MKKRILSFQPVHAVACMLLCVAMTATYAQKKKQPPVKTKPDPNAAYGSASYAGIQAGQYIRTWLLAGPFLLRNDTTSHPDRTAQQKFFDDDLVTQVVPLAGKPMPPVVYKGKPVAWKTYTSGEDIVDFDKIFNKADYAYAYALAEIKTDSAFTAFLGVGSDDAVKVWLNGKLIHNNWTARGVTPDEDFIEVNLAKGSNQLLIKVQDVEVGWGLAARFLDGKALTERLIKAAGSGDLDEINILLKAKTNINGKNSSGLTALMAARINGREEVANVLLQKGASDTPVPAGEQLVDGLYIPLLGKDIPGVAVLVAKDGNILYKKAFGYADVKGRKPVTPDTKFRIGSITKQFTACAILKLQEDGKLKVTDKLSKYIHDFPRGDEVTLHHLLTHTSGIHSYTGKDDFLKRVVSPVTTEELINYFKNDPYDFNPGEQWRYNNSGYFLLGYIIEKVSGKTYAQYLKETFFGPLQMTNTGVHTTWVKLDKEALGYDKNGNASYTPALNWNMAWAGGAGALYSTVEDLYKWNEAVFNGKVLEEKSLKAAFTSVVLNDGKTPPGEYGYGWGIGDYRGEHVIQHSGGLHGFLSQLARYTEENLTVVMLTNVVPADAVMNPNTVAECFLWQKMDKQTSYSVQPGVKEDVTVYIGRYDFGSGAVMTITADAGNLYAQLTGQPRFPIYPSAPGEYFWKVVEARIRFVKNDKGEVIHGHFTQGTFTIDAKKLSEEPVISLDQAIFNDYVGRYNYGDNIFISVTNEEGKLYAQATDQQKLQIFPVSEKEFVLKEMNARVTFVREATGKISKMIVDIGGQKKDALRVE